MARYFFDFRSDGSLSAEDEGLELLDADAAHQQAVGAQRLRRSSRPLARTC
jgi:hypothetical protein